MNNDLSNIQILKEDFKRERKHNAVKLPIELKQESIPKYVTYYKECYNIQKKLYREFFKIEKHPKMIKGKVYVSSKSNKINILEKLEEIKKILEKLNNVGENEYNEEKQDNKEKQANEDNEEKQENNSIIKLPKYVSLKIHEKDSNKYYLIYDKKNNNKRITLSSLYSKNESINFNINSFLSKIENKLIELEKNNESNEINENILK